MSKELIFQTNSNLLYVKIDKETKKMSVNTSTDMMFILQILDPNKALLLSMPSNHLVAVRVDHQPNGSTKLVLQSPVPTSCLTDSYVPAEIIGSCAAIRPAIVEDETEIKVLFE